MSETKWTPGPWDKISHYERESRVGANSLLAVVYSTAFRDRENQEANAYLIAAAPDLYEALVAIDDNWEIGGFTGPEDPRAQDLFTDRTIAAWRKIRAALAKARGEA